MSPMRSFSASKWMTVCLGDVAAITMGQSPPSSTINDEGIGFPFIQGNAEFGVRIPRPIKFCTDPQKQAVTGDILLSVRAPVGAMNLANGQLCVGRGLSAITATGVNPGFLWYVLAREVPKLGSVSQGSTFAAVNKADLHRLELDIPPYHEQRVIAEALSDVDEMLGALEALIAKKNAIRLASMQQLLTGKTRLPGFDGGWTPTTLGDAAEIVNGATPNSRNAAYWNGHIPWCTPTDITRTPGKYLTQTERSITAAGLASCSARLLPVGTLLLCSRATIGHIKIAAAPVCTNQGFKSLICNDGVCNDFLYYLLITMQSHLIERSIGSTFLEIGKREVASVEVRLPPHDEQRAIAAVLSDLDAEIAVLEQRRDKTQAIKQGMMQQLLTGRVRLAKPASMTEGGSAS